MHRFNAPARRTVVRPGMVTVDEWTGTPPDKQTVWREFSCPVQENIAMQTATTHFQHYASEIKSTLDRMPWTAVAHVADEIHAAWRDQRTVFIFGNGGSASTAQHMAADLSKNTAVTGLQRLRAVCLNDNIALITALANDTGYDNIFADQLINFGHAEDLVIAISTSGNSPNVLQGVAAAHRIGATVVGITGYQGGELAKIADISVVVPSQNVEQIEDVHVIIEHMLTSAVRASLQVAARRAA